MPGPFPGMDPYLEEEWEDVHHRLIGLIADQLGETLPDDLVCRANKKVVMRVDDADDGPGRWVTPDDYVAVSGGGDGSGWGAAAAAVLDATEVYEVAAETYVAKWLEVRDRRDREVITTFEGIRLLPDMGYLTDTLPKIDILVVPSAEHHLDTDLEDQEMLAFVRRAAGEALFVTSHCDGAFVLAKAGLLDGRVSTTFPSDVDAMRRMFPHLDVRDSLLFVHDGKYITSAGGAKSFEAALYLTEHLYGAAVARRLAQGLVIDWQLEAVPHLVVE